MNCLDDPGFDILLQLTFNMGGRLPGQLAR
jgi:hypothetical protein